MKSVIAITFASVLATSAQAALYLQLKADDLALSDGAEVTSWTDSASGNVFTNPGGSTTTPNYVADYNGSGKGAVNFAGATDFLQDTTLAATTPDTATMTVFIVGQFNAIGTGVDQYMIAAQNSAVDSGDNRLRLVERASDWRIRVGDGSNINSTGDIADTDHHVFTVVSGAPLTNDARLLIANSEVLDGTHGVTANAANLNRLNLGGFDNNGTPKDFSNSMIAEIRIYDTAMSAAEITTVHNELAAFYAPVPEPSSAALLGLGGLALMMRRRK